MSAVAHYERRSRSSRDAQRERARCTVVPGRTILACGTKEHSAPMGVIGTNGEQGTKRTHRALQKSGTISSEARRMLGAAPLGVIETLVLSAPLTEIDTPMAPDTTD